MDSATIATLIMAIATFFMAGGTTWMACETRKHRKLFEEMVEEDRKKRTEPLPKNY